MSVELHTCIHIFQADPVPVKPNIWVENAKRSYKYDSTRDTISDRKHLTPKTPLLHLQQTLPGWCSFKKNTGQKK